VVGYDAGRELERLPSLAMDDLRLPRLWGLLADEFLAIDHARSHIRAVACPREGESPKQTEVRAWDMLDRLRQPAPAPEGRPAGTAARSNLGARSYEERVGRAKRYVAAGDVYQVNLAHRLTWEDPSDALWLYQRLRSVNPSPFAFYVDAGDWQLASCSPERLLRVQGRRVETRPIAGTYPRSAEEAQQAHALRADPKERAEHTMLVDLERNDLGRCCEYGTIRVEEFLATEAYSHVVHLVSSVTGQLRQELRGLDAARACFPGGTITGAPKLRAMEIIEELEPSRRGFYTGSAGWLGFNGDADLNIVIRTILRKDGQAHASVGAGIVADSDPSREWRETLHKARALLLAAGVDPP
jgi:anthranilate/para-aminobenzoate synthase component I